MFLPDNLLKVFRTHFPVKRYISQKNTSSQKRAARFTYNTIYTINYKFKEKKARKKPTPCKKHSYFCLTKTLIYLNVLKNPVNLLSTILPYTLPMRKSSG